MLEGAQEEEDQERYACDHLLGSSSKVSPGGGEGGMEVEGEREEE